MENFCGSKPPEGGCGSRQAQGFYPLWQPTASVFHGNRRFADCDPIAQFDRFDPRTTIGLPLEVRAVSRALDFLIPVSEALPQRGTRDSNPQPRVPTRSQNRKRPNAQSHRANGAEECVRHMMQGTSLIKVRPRRHYYRVLVLSQDLKHVRWTPGRPRSCAPLVAVEDIREVRCGRTTKVHRDSRMPAGYPDDWAFSIVYGDDLRTLDLIAHSAEDARTWVAGLCALIGDPNPAAGGGLREQWLSNAFHREAARCGGRLGPESAARLAARLMTANKTPASAANPADLPPAPPPHQRGRTPPAQAAHERIAQKLAENGRRRSIESAEFIETYKQVVTRPEVYFLLLRFSHKEYMTAEDLKAFLETEQGDRTVELSECEEIINRSEPSPEAREQGVMLVDGFSRFLESDECLIALPADKTDAQLNLPLSHYYISSAHDAYVPDDPAANTASMDAIVRALAQPCRYVKLDLHDGVAGPVVCRNATCASRLPASDVLRLIRELAFVVSQCPLLLHLSVRCSPPQQRSLATLLRAELGEKLLLPQEARDPAQLEVQSILGRILLVGKKLPSACHEEMGSVQDEDDVQGAGPGVVVRELSDLFALEPRSCHAVDAAPGHAPGRLCSLSDSLASKMSRLRPEDMIAHCRNSLTRVFPNHERTGAANFNPQDAWNAGCQIVAVNLQTPGQHMDVYEGRFRTNGGTGLAPKPAIMCDGLPFPAADPRHGLPGTSPLVLRITVISGQNLPRPRGCDARGTAIDPYVAVQVFGVQVDNNEKKTRTVSNEGDCPVFEETFEMVIFLPELALLRFVVLDDEYIGDPFIGQFTAPLQSLSRGYRVVRLLNAAGEPLDGACLFVHIEMWHRRGRQNSKKRYKKEKLDLRTVGINSVDDLVKSNERPLRALVELRSEADLAVSALRCECGVSDGASMQHCLRVIMNRIQRTRSVRKAYIQEVDGSPMLRLEADTLSENMTRCLCILDRACEQLASVRRLHDATAAPVLELCAQLEDKARDFPNLALGLGLKGAKFTKASDNLAWNVRVIRGALRQLAEVKEEAEKGLWVIRRSAKAISRLSGQRPANQATPQPPSLSRTSSATTKHAGPTASGSDPDSLGGGGGGRLSPQSNSSTSRSPAASPCGTASGGVSPTIGEMRGVSPRPPVRGILKQHPATSPHDIWVPEDPTTSSTTPGPSHTSSPPSEDSAPQVTTLLPVLSPQAIIPRERNSESPTPEQAATARPPCSASREA
ncbi:Inactive phospholipase C-like protein 1, partial [Frankliniella fusca]